MMRRRTAIALLLCAVPLGAALPCPALAEDAAGFVAGTEDIPLMPGLRNEPNTLVVFDKPQGRIVEAEARGKVSRAAVEKFYAASLPELGWKADGPDGWRRDDEELHIDFKGRDGDLRVGFSLSPH
ncbi:MAG: hypothetical protein JO255_01425 [Alphaproteobacteria bacterium]|nr:hypothetical protein [Alphaproteobacteria bacterium]